MNSTKSINDKYLQAQSLASDRLIMSEWACKVAEVYLDLLVAQQNTQKS